MVNSSTDEVLEDEMSDSSAVTGSRRDALRFRFKEEFWVSYKTAYKDGDALLEDISTGGCAVRKASVPIAVDEKILFSFVVNNLDEPLEIRGVCIRLDGDGFAVKFLGLDGRAENRIVKLLAAQARTKND